jgi:hypothetical protein
MSHWMSWMDRQWCIYEGQRSTTRQLLAGCDAQSARQDAHFDGWREVVAVSLWALSLWRKSIARKEKEQLQIFTFGFAPLQYTGIQ